MIQIFISDWMCYRTWEMNIRFIPQQAAEKPISLKGKEIKLLH